MNPSSSPFALSSSPFALSSSPFALSLSKGFDTSARTVGRLSPNSWKPQPEQLEASTRTVGGLSSKGEPSVRMSPIRSG